MLYVFAGDVIIYYFKVQISLIFCKVWGEESASCFVWI